MFIDFLFAILMVMAIFKGFSRGFIIAVFSFVAFIVGLVAAMKLSASVAEWLKERSGTEGAWWPFIAFILVMILVMLLIRLGAKMLEKVVEMAMMGWLNKLGGIIFYAIMYITFFSIILFYATQLKLLSEETIINSKTYAFIAPWGPKAIEAIGEVIPIFKGLFQQLESFFDSANTKINSN